MGSYISRPKGVVNQNRKMAAGKYVASVTLTGQLNVVARGERLDRRVYLMAVSHRGRTYRYRQTTSDDTHSDDEACAVTERHFLLRLLYATSNSNMATKTPIMAITTKNSTSVKPGQHLFQVDWQFIPTILYLEGKWRLLLPRVL